MKDKRISYGSTSAEPRFRPEGDVIAPQLRNCETTGCGQVRGSGRPPYGWIQVYISDGVDVGHWYCSGHCATRGIAHVELGHHRNPATARETA